MDQYSLGTLLLHNVIDVFAAGRSDLKEIAFILFVIVLAVLYFIPWKDEWNGWFQKVKISFVGLSALLFAEGAALYFILFGKIGVSVNNVLLLFGSRELSTTYFFHNHVMKGAIGLLAHYLGMNVFYNADLGNVYINVLPHWCFFLGILGMILLPLGALYLYKVSVSRYSSWNALLFSFLYALISFSLIKNIYDGGLFNVEAVPVFSAFLLIMWGWKRSWKSILSLHVMMAAAYCAFFASSILPYQELQRLLLQLAGLDLFFGGLWLLLGSSSKRLALELIVLGLVTFIPLFQKSFDIHDYASLQIEKGSLATSYYPLDGDKIVDSFNSLNVYELDDQSKRVGDILPLIDGDSNYYPIAVMWKNCFPLSPLEQRTFDVLSFGPLRTDSFAQHSLAHITGIIPGSTHNGWSHYKVSVDMSSCLPRSVNVFQELINEQGGTVFAIPLPLYDESSD